MSEYLLISLRISERWILKTYISYMAFLFLHNGSLFLAVFFKLQQFNSFFLSYV